MKIFSPVAKFWDCNSRPKAPLLHTLCNDSSTFNSTFVISSDSQTLISSDYNNGIKLWNLQTGKLNSTLSKGFARNINYTSSTSSDRVVRATYPTTYVSISPDNQTLIAADFRNGIRLWNLRTRKLKSILTDSFGTSKSIAISPDSQILVNKRLNIQSRTDSSIQYASTETIDLWNLETGESLGSITTGQYSYIDSITISPNGQILIASISEWITESAGFATVSRWRKSVKLWNLKTRELMRTIRIEDDNIVISPDNKTLISFGSWNDSTIKLWNLQTGKLIKKLTGSFRRVNSIIISPDSRILASTGSTTYNTAGTIELWNLQTGELLRTIPVKKQTWSFKSTIAISPDIQTFSFGASDGTIELWNLQTGQLKTTLKSHRWVEAIAFTPDSKTLVSSSFDGIIKVWRLP